MPKKFRDQWKIGDCVRINCSRAYCTAVGELTNPCLVGYITAIDVDGQVKLNCDQNGASFADDSYWVDIPDIREIVKLVPLVPEGT